MAVAQLERILGNLLVPDNSVIQQVSRISCASVNQPRLKMNFEEIYKTSKPHPQATKELQIVYKDPAIIQPLCDILYSSQNAQVSVWSCGDVTYVVL